MYNNMYQNKFAYLISAQYMYTYMANIQNDGTKPQVKAGPRAQL